MCVHERSQVEIREVVGIAGQEDLFAVHPLPVGGERTRAAQQLRFVERPNRREPLIPGQITAYHVRQVVQVEEDLVDTGPVERVKPDVKQGPTVDVQHALRGDVGDRPQAAADPGREEKRLHASALRTTPRARIRAFASVSTPSRPSMPSSHSAYAATDSVGVRFGSQPSARRALMSETMCRVSPKRYSPVTTAGSLDP